MRCTVDAAGTGTVARVLDSSGTRVVAYVAVAALAAAWYVRERRSLAGPLALGEDARARWPAYWMLTAVVLATMAIGRAGALGDVVAELGREQARGGGWYERRRELQAGAVGVIATAWLLAVFVAIWRVPPRRRRYLPNVVVISSLVAFAAVRMISLHQIDALLYRRDIGGLRIVTIVELGLLAIASITIAIVDHRPATPASGSDGSDRDDPGADHSIAPGRR